MKRPLRTPSLALARLICLLACAGVGAGVGATSLAQSPPEDANFAADETGRKIVELAQAYESAGFRGAVLAARDGKVIAAVGVGHADLKGEQPIVPSTLFEIASITKPFTAVEAMRLAAAGKLDLDASISEYLPGVPDECKPITVRHLLQHTSGIPGTNSQGSGDDLAAVLPVFLKGGPQHEPGTHWEYWNQGYSLLSEIIARASEESCVDYCRHAIFEPAGMAHSCFTGDAAPEGVNVAVGTSGYGEPRSALEHPYGSYGYQYRGMGGLVTNVWDLWRWDRALAGEALLSEASKTEMFTPGDRSYGLGWFVLTNKAGRLMQSHSGGVRGFACDFRRFPEHEALVVVLSARDDVPVWRIAEAVETTLFGDGQVQAPPAPLESQMAGEIAGRYEDQRGNALTVERQDAATRATVKWTSGPTTRAILGLGPQGGLVFYDWMSAIGVEVVRDEAGAVDALTIDGHPYQRIKPGAEGARPVAEKQAAPKTGGEVPDWAALLLGRYQDEKGIELVVATSGRMVTAQIHWSPQGPITYARLERTEAGEFEFVEFSRSPSKYPVEIVRNDAGKAQSITLVAEGQRQKFERVQEK
ncbi:MAG: beta-lactamase family protein [Phycisphaerales bacterium]|nr:beta-lactamase family protein [Phycisphaerales bacterium]